MSLQIEEDAVWNPYAKHEETIESLRRELENERARDIHSCGPDCTRSGCVNRRLRKELAEARQEIADRKADCETGHDQDEATIAELRRQLVEKHVEVKRLKQSHLEEMSAVQIRLAENKDQLAASQAREQQFRELLSNCIVPFANATMVKIAKWRVEEAFALPNDTTALQSMVAKAGEVMRERAHSAMLDLKPWDHRGEIIRALPAVTLDDLK